MPFLLAENQVYFTVRVALPRWWKCTLKPTIALLLPLFTSMLSTSKRMYDELITVALALRGCCAAVIG